MPRAVADTLKSSAFFSRHPEIAAAYLFGSYARGQARSDSEIDIGIVYVSPQARTRHDAIATAIAADVGRRTAIERVDVVDLEAQGAIFAHDVLCEAVRLYEGDAARRTDFESETIVRALDFRPTYDLATQGKVAALRKWLREQHDVGSALVEARHLEVEPR